MLQDVSFNKVFFNNCTFLACLHVFISFVLACATHTRISLCRLHASPPHEDGRLPVVQLRTARSPPPHMISYIFWLTSISYLVSQAKVPDKDASHWIPCYLRSSCSHVKSGFKIKKKKSWVEGARQDSRNQDHLHVTFAQLSACRSKMGKHLRKANNQGSINLRP